MDICYSLIALLNSCFPLLSDSSTEAQRAAVIIQGFHGLQVYANMFWTKHLLAYCSLLIENRAQFSRELQTELQLLLRFRKHNDPLLPSTSKNTALGVLDDMPDIKSLVSDTVEFQAKMVRDTTSYKSFEGNYLPLPLIQLLNFLEMSLDSCNKDPNNFSTTRHYYQQTVEALLDNKARSTFPTISVQDINAFREIYGISAFVCRYPHCDSSTDGFDSSSRRAKHEAQHQRRFCCAVTSCLYFTAGFPTKNRLNKHNEKYHPVVVEGPSLAESLALPRLIGYGFQASSDLDEGAPKDGLQAASDLDESPPTTEGHYPTITLGLVDEPQQPQKQPMLFRPEHMRSLPDVFSADQKAKWKNGLAMLYRQIEQYPAESKEHMDAVKKIRDFSRTLHNKIHATGIRPQVNLNQLVRQSQALSQPSQADGTAPLAQSQSSTQATPVRPVPSENMRSHINNFPYIAPANFAPGSSEAQQWIDEIKDKYLEALMTMENTAGWVMQLQALAAMKTQGGKQLTSEEQKELQLKNESFQKNHNAAKRFVDGFRRQQAEAAAKQAQSGGGTRTEPQQGIAVLPPPAINTQQQMHQVQQRPQGPAIPPSQMTPSQYQQVLAQRVAYQQWWLKERPKKKKS